MVIVNTSSSTEIQELHHVFHAERMPVFQTLGLRENVLKEAYVCFKQSVVRFINSSNRMDMGSGNQMDKSEE